MDMDTLYYIFYDVLYLTCTLSSFPNSYAVHVMQLLALPMITVLVGHSESSEVVTITDLLIH